jgi:hypothetical protein
MPAEKREATAMSVLNELSSATGDKESNINLVKRCLQTPAFVHSIAEGLRTGTPKAKEDCMEIMIEVAKRRPELLANFVSDFIDASRGKSKKIARQALGGLVYLVPVSPSDVYAERDHFFDVAKTRGPMGLAAAGVIASLCANSTNYRGKLIGNAIRLLYGLESKDLPRWVAALAPAAEGSQDSIKRLKRDLEPQLANLDVGGRKKVDATLNKLERSLGKRR